MSERESLVVARDRIVAELRKGRTIPMQMRGTPASAPLIRKLFDAVAVNAPDDDFGYALVAWAEEVTRRIENAE